MRKLKLTDLKRLINESVKKALLEDLNSLLWTGQVPHGGAMTVPAEPAAWPGPAAADMDITMEESIAGQFQTAIQLMTNVGALMDNPNTSRPSLTSAISSGNRELETRLVQRINAQHRQLGTLLRSMASDRTSFNPQIRAAVNRALATARNVQNGMVALAGQPAAQQVAAIREFKREYVAASGALRSIRDRFAAFSPDAPGGPVRNA